MMPPIGGPVVKDKRSHRHDKLARLYDAEILPIWTQRFGRMLLRDLALPPRANVLEVGCRTGDLTLELLARRRDDQTRIIAIDPVGAMLDVARAKAGPLSGRRIYFRSESAEPRLSFAEGVYDLVVANCVLHEMDDPPAVLRDLVRVTKPGGHVALTAPLDGTFGELYDIFREVLIKLDRAEALARLDEHLGRQLTLARLCEDAERAGLVDVETVEERFTLLFKSSREFFLASLVDYCWLPEWMRVAGEGPEAADVIVRIKDAIDAYFGPSSFGCTVVAGMLRARKPTEEEAVLLFPAPRPPGGEVDGEHRDTVSRSIRVGTGEIEFIDAEEVFQEGIDGIDADPDTGRDDDLP